MEASTTIKEHDSKREFEVMTFRISNVRLMAEEQISSHSQATWELSMVTCGHGRRMIGASEEPFSDGDLVLVPPHVEHCWRFDPGQIVRNITVEINPSWIENLPTVMPEMDKVATKLMAMSTVAVTFSPSIHDEIAHVLRRMVRKDRIDQLSLLLRLLQVITSEGNAKKINGAEPRASIDEQRKERLRIYIECNHNRRITLDMAASQVGMSRTSFCRWFRQNYSTSFVAHLRSVRLERMASLLSDPMTSINEACYLSGFADTAYATRLFHARFGLTPTSYRATIINKKGL